MGLRLFFLPNYPRATFIQGATFIPDSIVALKFVKLHNFGGITYNVGFMTEDKR